MSREELLAEIEAFLVEEGITATRFGKEALGDSAFIFDLRNGRDLQMSTAAKVRKFMADRRAGSGPLARSAA